MDDGALAELIDSIPKHSIEVYVPGRQITLAHVIRRPALVIYEKLSLEPNIERLSEWAIGILKFTPWEAAIPAGNIAMQSADIKLGFADRFMGTLVFTGKISAIEAALSAVLDYYRDVMGYNVPPLTKS